MRRTWLISFPLILIPVIFVGSCDDFFVGENPPDNPQTNFEIFWNEFDSHYSFFEIKNVDWDSVYTVYNNQIHASTSDRDLFNIFGEMSLLLNDGHVSVESNQFGIKIYRGFYTGKPRNFIPSSLSNYVDHIRTRHPFTYGNTSSATGYVRVSTFSGPNDSFQMFSEVLNSLGNIESLILDIRDNVGGSNQNAQFLSGHFTGKPFNYGFFRYRNGPGHNDFTDWREMVINPVGHQPFTGSVILLTNRRCYSSTEEFIMAMKSLPDITQIGDTTGGGSGNPLIRELPNGWTYRISHWQQVDLDFNQFEGRGFYPDVPIWISEQDSLHGLWIKHYETDYKIPFSASFDVNNRFNINPERPAYKISGEWAVSFYNQEDTTEALGIFKQSDNELTGTFLTSTGDYRFLEGIVDGDKMYLSAFNGTSAYLFKADINQNEIRGDFYSGKSSHKKWFARKNGQVNLPEADMLTTLNPGYKHIQFSLPDLSGDTISYNDERFQNKVVIVQILGTWCPNCMDETAFLANWYDSNKNKPVEIVGLAFERKDDFNYAKRLLDNFVAKYEVNYPILFAGSKDMKNLRQKLPMLDRLMAFPTTIFIDKQGKIRKIHTGFSGPGTGEYYEKFKRDFNSYVDQLIKENHSI